MARGILLLVLIIIVARLFWRFVDAVLRGVSTAAPRAGRPGGPPTSVKMQPCPVCGTFVVPGKAISQTSGNAAVYFCSTKCRDAYHAT